MATLEEIRAAITTPLNDGSYTPAVIDGLINSALQAIAGGILMPDGSLSPALPDLYTYGTVSSDTAYPYVALPSNYQRRLFYIADSSNCKIFPPNGGDYYSYNLFVNQITNKNLSESGSIYRVCVKGKRLYYQGIPATSTDLTIHYYRKPETMDENGSEPEGLPAHLALFILKHFVLKEELGTNIEDGQDSLGKGTNYHASKFFEYMNAMIRVVGIDAEPQYFGGGIPNYDPRMDY